MLVSDADKTRISAAIAAAERNTSGEIFCVIARQSGHYRLVPVVIACAVALLVPLPLVLFTAWPAKLIYIAQLLVFVLASLLLSLPVIRFRIVPSRIKHGEAHAEAERQFSAQGLHKTEHRTGVLIFASEAEHYAVVIADAGINDKVAPEVWDEAVAVLVDAIGKGRAADGFIASIACCDVVLARHFPPGVLNRNELPNRLIEI